MLLQFGADRTSVDESCVVTGTQSQGDTPPPIPPMELLSCSSRVYPCDVRVSGARRCDASPAVSAVSSQSGNPEDDAKQQVSNPFHNELFRQLPFFIENVLSSSSTTQVLHLLSRLIVPEILSQAGGQNRIPCPKCGVSRSRYCCTCLLPIGVASCHPVPLLAPFQISIIQHR